MFYGLVDFCDNSISTSILEVESIKKFVLKNFTVQISFKSADRLCDWCIISPLS